MKSRSSALPAESPGAEVGDTIRGYVRTTSRIKLLSREEEVELTSRFNRGRRKILRAVMELPFAGREEVEYDSEVFRAAVSRIKALARGVAEADRSLEECRRRAGMSLEKLFKTARGLRSRDPAARGVCRKLGLRTRELLDLEQAARDARGRNIERQNP